MRCDDLTDKVIKLDGAPSTLSHHDRTVQQKKSQIIKIVNMPFENNNDDIVFKSLKYILTRNGRNHLGQQHTYTLFLLKTRFSVYSDSIHKSSEKKT